MTDSRPLFGTPFLSDVMDFERAGNSVLLDRLPLRRHGHDIDRTQYATRRKISAHSPRLRRHLRLSRHRNYNRHHRETRVSVGFAVSVHLNELDRPFGYQMSLRDCGYRCGCVYHAFENRGSKYRYTSGTKLCVPSALLKSYSSDIFSPETADR